MSNDKQTPPPDDSIEQVIADGKELFGRLIGLFAGTLSDADSALRRVQADARAAWAEATANPDDDDPADPDNTGQEPAPTPAPPATSPAAKAGQGRPPRTRHTDRATKTATAAAPSTTTRAWNKLDLDEKNVVRTWLRDNNHADLINTSGYVNTDGLAYYRANNSSSSI